MLFQARIEEVNYIATLAELMPHVAIRDELSLEQLKRLGITPYVAPYDTEDPTDSEPVDPESIDESININTDPASRISDEIKGIGPATAKAIVESRPFDSIDDLLARVQLSPMAEQSLIELESQGSLAF